MIVRNRGWRLGPSQPQSRRSRHRDASAGSGFYAPTALNYPLIALHTFSGLAGMFMCFTPNGASASITAFITAGDAAIVPVSPAPFTPSGLVGEGVTVRSVMIDGSQSAVGMA